MNAKNLEMLLDVIIRNKIKKCTIYIWGSSGCGKTTIVKSVAAKYNMKSYTFGCESITDPGDLRGGIVNVMADLPDGKKGYVMQYSIPELIKNLWEKPAILLFDELPRTPPQSQNAIMSVFTEERRLGMWKIPDHTTIIAAGNPNTSDGAYFGNEMDFAQVERFCHISYAPSRDEVIRYLSDQNRVCEGILTYFAQVPDAMYAPLLPLPYKVKATPRSIEALGELINAMTKEEFAAIGLEVCEGLMGEHASGIIQSIQNSMETPVPAEDFLNGRAKDKFEKWAGNSIKIGLFNASMRNLSAAIENNHQVWAAFATKTQKNYELLEPFAESLLYIPIDLLRRYVKEFSTNANKVIALMIKNSMENSEKFPKCREFVTRLQELKREEERLAELVNETSKS